MGSSPSIAGNGQADKWVQVLSTLNKSNGQHRQKSTTNRPRDKSNDKLWDKIKHFQVAHAIHNLEPRATRSGWKEKLASATKNAEKLRKIHAKKTKLDRELLYSIVKGDIPETEVKSMLNKDVWIFLSSTFTDMKVERDFLLEDVYPYLRQYYRKVGYNFNVVDLRWGVREYATDEHETTDICNAELIRCRNTSAGPYFAGIIGRKYGYRPFPTKIKQPLYESFLELTKSNSTGFSDTTLMKKWFKLDENALEPEYILQPISTHYKGHNKGVNADVIAWNSDFGKMQSIFRQAARYCDMTEAEREEYFISITEKEIRGVIYDEEPSERPSRFYFNRDVSNLDTGKPNARFFIDMVDGKVDPDATERLKVLKQLIESKLAPEQKYRYEVNLDEEECVLTYQRNVSQITELADRFCQVMMDSILKFAALAINIDEDIYIEILRHSIFCKDRSSSFVGRTNYINKIHKYLSDKAPHVPLVVHGISGSGKTSIVAKVYSQLLEQGRENNYKGLSCIRFIGITPSSSSIRELLYSLCQQIALFYNKDIKSLRRDFRSVTQKFHDLLVICPRTQKPLVIFIDSLDQLNEEDDAHSMVWMPRSLPDNVYIVLSSLPGICLQSLQSQYRNTDHYIEVETLATNDATEIIEFLMQGYGRKLTNSQRSIILKTCEKPTALYLKLACAAACRWKSYTPDSDIKLAPNSREIIKQFFDRLKEIHGPVFVKRALGYITASKNGLSSSELEDILSCDEEALYDVFQFHIPPLRRLPTLLWTRLRNDLGDYLAERGSDGVIVYSWYHRQFREVAQEYFLGNADFKMEIHSALVEYFTGRWANTPKPFKNKKTGEIFVACRMVPEQPTIFCEENQDEETDHKATASTTQSEKKATVKYNDRKLSELAHHLIESKDWGNTQKVMCDVEWLEAKCKSGRVFELCIELSQASLLAGDNPMLDTCYKFIRSSSNVLQDHPDMLFQEALNQPDESVIYNMAIEYVQSKDMKSEKDQQNIRQHYVDQVKSQTMSAEIALLEHPEATLFCKFSDDCKYLGTYCTDNMIRVWQVISGSLLMKIKHPTIKAIAFPPHCEWVVAWDNDEIILFGLKKDIEGSIIKRIPCAYTVASQIFISGKTPNDSKISLIEKNQFKVFNTVTGKEVSKKALQFRPQASCFSNDGKMIAVIAKKAFLYSLTNFKEIRKLPTNKSYGSDANHAVIQLSRDCKKVAAVLPDGTYMWQVSSGKQLGQKLTLSCTGDHKFISFSLNLDYIAIPNRQKSRDLQLMILDKGNSLKRATLRGHALDVTSCAIVYDPGNIESTVLATTSKDGTVRLWDGSCIAPTSTEDFKQPTHKNAVEYCLLSHKGDTLATASPGQHAWLWQMQPPKLITSLATSSILDTIKLECFSTKDDYVAATSDRGIEMWCLAHIKEDNLLSTESLLPYAGRIHFWTVFNRMGLCTIFARESLPNIVIAANIADNGILGEWKLSKTSPTLREPTTVEFKHNIDVKVIAATLSDQCDQLATIHVHSTSETVSDWLYAVPQITLWDYKTQRSLKNISTDKRCLSKHHLITLVNRQPVIYWQQSTTTDVNSAKEEKISEGIIYVGSLTGRLQLKRSLPGIYTKVWRGSGFLANNISLMGWTLGGVSNRVLNIVNLISKKTIGKATIHGTDITSFDMTQDGSYIAVGCLNGEVHFLKSIDLTNLQSDIVDLK